MTSSPPRNGGLYFVRDGALSLPPNSDREIHLERRPVVVLSGDAPNGDSSWPFVLIAPLSSSTSRRTRYCVRIQAGEGNSQKTSWVRVSATQPLLKADLSDFLGDLPAERVEDIQSNLLLYMGLIESDVDDV